MTGWTTPAPPAPSTCHWRSTAPWSPLSRPTSRSPMVLRWLSAASALAAATPAGAQQIKELGIQATGTLSDPALAVGGVYGAWRPSSRGRISAAFGLGGSDGHAAWRGELLGHFLLAPGRK